MKDLLYKTMFMSVIKSDDEKATIKAIFSTPNDDRHGERVNQKWDLKNFRANPVILNSHNQWDAKAVVGKAIKIGMSKGNLVGEIEFAVEANPDAKIIYELYKGGFLNAFSVGFIAKKFSADYSEILEGELLEISCVAVPANAEALQQAKAKGIEIEKLNPYSKFTEPKKEEIDEEIDEELEEEVKKPKKKPKKELVDEAKSEDEDIDDEIDKEEEKEAEIKPEGLEEDKEEVKEPQEEEKEEKTFSALFKAVQELGKEAQKELVETLEWRKPKQSSQESLYQQTIKNY